ncbi:LexA family protein [Microbulbifer sp. SA54]|uniref:LexA family protein n=1 Tax=Microbulbifer sp. SA54 TaxID=3401577 RepID=UPI003AAC554F
MDELLDWPCEQTPESDIGVVVAATIRLYRRRPDPSPKPQSVHDWLIRRPFATYLVKAEGRSMSDHGIHHGSLLVVDRSCDLHDGDIVIAGCADGFLVKQYRTKPVRLVAGNTDYPDIVLERAPQFDLDGVVIASLTRHRGAA